MAVRALCILGSDLEDGHAALVNPGPTPDQAPLPEDEDAEPYMPGDDLLA